MEGCYGFFGVYDILYVNVFCVLIIIVFMFIINGFNLIDGINGLVGSFGILVVGMLGGWFFWVGCIELFILFFVMVGVCVVFFKFNYMFVKIFMGDFGFFVIGMICLILIIFFIEVNY